MRSRPLMLLALACLALASALAWAWFTPRGQLRSEVHWSEPAALQIDYVAMLPALPGVAPTDTQQFLALLERPLFSLTRRPPLPPPPPKPVEAPPPPDNLSTARLQAIFEVPGEGGSIILQIAGKSQRVRVNGRVDGWTVQAIDGRSVTFARRDQTRVLQLQRAELTTYTGLAAPATRPAAPATSASNANPASGGAVDRRTTRAASSSPAAGAPPPGPRAVFGGGR